MNGKDRHSHSELSQNGRITEKSTVIPKNGKKRMLKSEGSGRKEGTSEGFTEKAIFELGLKGMQYFENSSTSKLAGGRKHR